MPRQPCFYPHPKNIYTWVGVRFIHMTDPNLSAEKQMKKGEGEERRAGSNLKRALKRNKIVVIIVQCAWNHSADNFPFS